jgi:hypothetical protein
MPQHLTRRSLQPIARQVRTGDACLHCGLHHVRHDLVRQTEG